MAQIKAVHDNCRNQLEKEAKNIILDWYYGKHSNIEIEDLFVVWFAYLRNGYKCMVSSRKNLDDFFEITVNKITDEQYVNYFKRVGYRVKPKGDANFTEQNNVPHMLA